VRKNYVRLLAHLRPALQGTTLLGVLMIGLLWIGVIFHLRVEHDRAEQDAIEGSGKLVLVLAESAAHAIREADATLLFLRTAYEKDPQNFKFADWRAADYDRDGVFQISIVGPDGTLKISTAGPVELPVNLGDREHFLVQVDSRDDRLFIGKPIVTRTTGRPSIQLTRPIRGPNGAFGGIISASFDPAYLGRLYETFDTSRNSAVGLVGSDGIYRASAGFRQSMIERSMLGTKLFQLIQEAPAGHFYSSGMTDGVGRLVSYGKVDGFPLYVTVGLGRTAIFAGYQKTQDEYLATATALTAFILIIMALSIRHAVRLRRARAEIDSRTRDFQSALQAMPQGLAMFDADKRLIMCNEQYARLYDAAETDLKPGTTLGQILEKRITRNLYRNASALKFMRQHYLQTPGNTCEIRELSNGRTIAVTVAPTAAGGWVATHEDVTENIRREASFQLLFDDNPIPMWVCDLESLRFLAINEAAIERYGYSREQFLAMTLLDIRPIEDRDRFSSYVRSEGVFDDGHTNWRHRTSSGATIDVMSYARSLNYAGHSAALVAAVDVTERVRAEAEVRHTKAFLSTLIESVPMPILVKSAQELRFIFVNRATEILFDLSRDEIIGKNIEEIFPTQPAEAITALDIEAMQSRLPMLTERHLIRRSETKEYIVDSRRIPILGDDGEPLYLLGVIEDVTDRTRSAEQIAYMAHHDALTGLANRAALAQKIDEATGRLQRLGDPFAVLLLDLDRFKQVNDTLGHPAGDALLREVAVRLKPLVQETGILARLGGDEFAIVHTDGEDAREAALALADRIIDVLGEPFDIESTEIIVGVSIGIALAPEHATDSHELLKMADLALYCVKSAGRGDYRFYDPEMSKVVSTRQELEGDLRRAVQQGELELHYQPIIDSKTRRICSAEALVRWRHPVKGLIYPDRFIPLAEETGLITQIGEWVLHTACAEAATWPADVKIAVNLSPVQFRKMNLPDVVMYALAESGLAPQRLELEITETALIESAAECLPALRQFRNLGITVALDDFGTGYSSLSQLAMFQFDKIKIDKSFTQNLTKRRECAAIISATLNLAHSLDIATTAEGVETAEQYRILQLAGVTSLQGYLFKEPGPACEFDFDNVYGSAEIGNAA
jgi:diguanylate cyclase (GGDEF)-like protein/PAS domain S-box-containing protein